MPDSNPAFEAMLRRGDDYAARNQWDRAAQDYLAAVKAVPSDIPAREKLALAFHRLGRFQQALDVLYMPLLTLRPANTAYLTPIAELQVKLNRTTDAEVTYRKLVDIYKGQEKLDRAAEVLQHLILLRPDDLALHAELESLTALPADALDDVPPLDMGDVAPTVAAPTIVAPPPSHIDSLIIEAETALEAERYDEAKGLYEQAVADGCNRADVFYSLGNLYMQTGQNDEAEAALRRATADEEYSPSAYYALAQLYGTLGRLSDSAQAYEQALKLIDLQTVGAAEAPELIVMYESAAQTYIDLGNEARAAALYTSLSGFLQNRHLNTDNTDRILARANALSEKNMQAQVQQKAATQTSPAPDLAAQTSGDPSRTAFLDVVTARSPGTSGLPVGSEGSFGLTSARSPVVEVVLPPFAWPTKLVNDEMTADIEPYIRASYDFIQRKLYVPAIDACLEIIRFRPDFVPIHVVLAEIYLLQKRVEAARTKLQVVTDLYTVRDQKMQALEVHKRLAQISPDNVALRTRLASTMLEMGQTTDAAELMLDVARDYERKGQTERALDEMRALRQMAPQSVPVRVEYGELLARTGAYDEALNEFRTALEREPANVRALVQLNIVLTRKDETALKWDSFKAVVEKVRGDETNAPEILSRYHAAALASDHPGLFYALAALEIETGATAEALTHFEETARLASAARPARFDYEALARLELGRLYLHQNAEEAIAQLGKVMRLEAQLDPAQFGGANDRYGATPSQLLVYRQLATAFMKLERYDQALNALKFVKRARPFDRDVYLELAELYYRQGQTPAALAELYELVLHYEKTNQTEAMTDILREMARLAPTNPTVHEKLSQVLLDRGQVEEGLRELDRLAELLQQAGRHKDAVRTLQRGAELYWMMNQSSKAFTMYDRILRIAPGDVEARQQLVNLHILAKRTRDAVEEQRTITQICLQANRAQEAIASLHQVIALAPEDTRAYFQLASLLASIKEYQQAYRIYSRLRKKDPVNVKVKALESQMYEKAVAAGQIVPGGQPANAGPIAEPVS